MSAAPNDHATTWQPTRVPFPFWTTVGYVAFGAVLVVATTIGVFVAMGVHRFDSRYVDISQAILAQSVANVVVIPYLLVVIRKLGNETTISSIFQRPTLSAVGHGCLAGLVLAIAVNGIATIVQYIAGAPHNGQDATVFLRPGHGLAIAVVFTLLLGPAAEELCFRGLIFTACATWLPLPIAIGISGFLFALAHGDALALVPLTVAGMILAYVFRRSGSIWTSFTAHALFNAVGILATLPHLG